MLGVRYVTASGELVRGRGRVVELSLKMLPKPEAYASLALDRETASQRLAR